MSVAMLGGVLGGIGLFLLGMWLMTDGLKLAAGTALRDLLARSTGTPLRGLLSGMFITGLVQSSSAVTVAIIGFVNAGLMDLRRAVIVIFGSNVGTTMTAWLVAAVGLNLDVKAAALPAVGVGMFLRLTGSSRRAALGQAIAGFGIFFLGIDLLGQTFLGLGDNLELAAAGGGPPELLLFTGIGFLLTLFTQSSSAALAVVLSAAAGGVVSLNLAAAMVIGANVGTTSTAALAVIGATPNAKRVAAAHVAFNLASALVALLILPALLYGADALRGLVGAGTGTGPAVVLALFHTLFNLLGVLLIWPLRDRLVDYLERRFRDAEEDEARPRYLDHNVANTPMLGLHALVMELGRVTHIAKRITGAVLSSEHPDMATVQREQRVLARLVDSVGEFSALMQRRELPPQLDSVLPDGLRVSRYATEMAELAEIMARSRGELPPLSDNALRAEAERFQGAVAALLEDVFPSGAVFEPAVCELRLAPLQEDYQRLKAAFLRGATESRIGVRAMVEWLDLLSNVRRSAEQACKAAAHLQPLSALLSQPTPAA